MNCDYFSEVKYKEFVETFNRNRSDERIPLSGIFELTYRCNLACVHCYCNEARDNQEIKDKELSASDIAKLLDDAAKRGCLFLLFTGGEPLLRDDFFEIYTYAKNKGFLITLFTNATLITPQVADFLKQWPPFEVEVTLYGMSERVYERITGVAGSFKHCMAGIRALLAKGLPLKLKTMVSTLNREELCQMREFAQSLKVDFRFDPLLHPRLDGSRVPLEYRIAPSEVVEFELMNDNRFESWKKSLAIAAEFKKSNLLFFCGAGRDTFSIGPFGRMGVCSSCLTPSYDIKENSFDEIWDAFFPEILKQERNISFECKNCDMEFFCANCPGYSMLEHGNLESVVEYACQVTRLRQEAFGKIYKKDVSKFSNKI